MIQRSIRIGAGAGFSGDRIDPALDLLEHGALDYLAFECLAERTIGLAQFTRQRGGQGYDPLLEDRMRAALPIARAHRVRVITNMGGADVAGAAALVIEIARELGLAGYRIAAVTGDDVLETILSSEHRLIDRGGTSRDLGTIVSANAYIGAEGIVTALRAGADTVITGRICDPALFLAPLIHEFGWAMDDWVQLGQGTLVGHLLECAGQLCGGYFADPGVKDVPDLARLGFPYADVRPDGSAVFSKLPDSGGLLSAATCKEQLLYEILDPGAYLQADVTADFTQAVVEECSTNRVRVSGGSGQQRPDTLKVSICYEDGYAGEGQISYAGPGAVGRGRLALDIVRERLRLTGAEVVDLRFDLIGVDSVDRRGRSRDADPGEVRVRVVGRATTERAAARIGAEVEALYTNGPSGGGGAARSTRQVLAVASTLIDRAMVSPRVDVTVA